MKEKRNIYELERIYQYRQNMDYHATIVLGSGIKAEGIAGTGTYAVATIGAPDGLHYSRHDLNVF